MTQTTPLENKFPLSAHLNQLVQAIESAGGHCLVVGGSVRDHLLGLSPKDIDIEVYHLSLSKLEEALKPVAFVHAVGKSFGVLKVTVKGDENKEIFDISLPRTENKTGKGHRGFVVETDQDLAFEKASARRDFTINALAIDLKKQVLLDAHDGLLDLKDKTLRHVSDAFDEDPLRVLRACQFAARFDLKLDPQTVKKCHNLNSELSTLASERIFEEIKKLLLAKKPSVGMNALDQVGALVLFPELEAMKGCPQEPKWHPEGDVWIHTNMVIDEAAKIVRREKLDSDAAFLIVLGALCHDLGKPSTTRREDGRIRSKNHEAAGEEPTLSFLKKLGAASSIADEIVPLVKEHLKPCQLFHVKDKVRDSAIKRLATRVNIEKLCLVAEADFLGRTTEDAKLGVDPSTKWLLEKAKQLSVEKEGPKPLLMGRHLIEKGIKPGPKMGKILEAAYDAQLEGAFSTQEDALLWLKENKYLKV